VDVTHLSLSLGQRTLLQDNGASRKQQ
jgi:hypothetical protein